MNKEYLFYLFVIVIIVSFGFFVYSRVNQPTIDEDRATLKKHDDLEPQNLAINYNDFEENIKITWSTNEPAIAYLYVTPDSAETAQEAIDNHMKMKSLYENTDTTDTNVINDDQVHRNSGVVIVPEGEWLDSNSQDMNQERTEHEVMINYSLIRDYVNFYNMAVYKELPNNSEEFLSSMTEEQKESAELKELKELVEKEKMKNISVEDIKGWDGDLHFYIIMSYEKNNYPYGKTMDEEKGPVEGYTINIDKVNNLF